MDKRIVLCPRCDRELKVAHSNKEARCKCGNVIKLEEHHHPREFWHNPDNSHRF